MDINTGEIQGVCIKSGATILTLITLCKEHTVFLRNKKTLFRKLNLAFKHVSVFPTTTCSCAIQVQENPLGSIREEKRNMENTVEQTIAYY